MFINSFTPYLHQMYSIKLILYKHKTLKSGTHPIMVQVIHFGSVSRRSTGFSSLPEHWNEEFSTVNDLHPDSKNAKKVLTKLKSKMGQAEAWLEVHELPFSSEQFFRRIFSESKSVVLLDLMKEKEESLREQDKVGSALVFRDSHNAIKRYIARKKITLQDVDVAFLNSFEQFLRRRGCNGGIRVYMESIRIVFNQAIATGIISMEAYPFARNKSELHKYHISKLRPDTNPRGLSPEDRESWKAFDSSLHPDLELTHIIQSFMYYARGMNFTDMAMLRREDFYDSRITYKRSKTKRYLDIKITETISTLLEKAKLFNSSTYVFPILDPNVHKSATQKKDRIKKCLKKHNQDLKRIASMIDIKINLTSYVSRHSYAKALLENDTPEHIIGHNLGHAPGNGRVLKHYLDKLDNSRYDVVDKCI